MALAARFAAARRPERRAQRRVGISVPSRTRSSSTSDESTIRSLLSSSRQRGPDLLDAKAGNAIPALDPDSLDLGVLHPGQEAPSPPFRADPTSVTTWPTV